MKHLLTLLAALPLLVAAQQKINYRVHYSNDMAENGLRVTVSTQLKKASDSTYFHYSNNVWGEDSLLRCVTALASDLPGYSFRIEPDSNRIVVFHPKSKQVRFSYRIRQDYPGESVDTFYRPRVKQHYFHIIGQCLFAVPEETFTRSQENDPELIATIEWVDFPSDFVLHNTFGSRQQKQVLKVRLWDEFYHSFFAGGDYRIYNFEHAGKPVYLAIRGEWHTYKDEELLASLKKTVAGQRSFWNDTQFGYYTVMLSPTVTVADSSYRGQGAVGTRVFNGFVIQSSNNPFNSNDVMNYLFNHEMMHEWIGGKIRMRHGALNYWFSEGFTDYYTYKNRLRSGDLSFEQWLSSFNADVIAAHYRNPERHLANYAIDKFFWKGRNYEKVPYRRGAIFAFWLDNELLLKSDYTFSLDDLMRELLTICTTEHKQFTDELFLELVEKYLGQDRSVFFQQHVLSGEDITPEEFRNLVDGLTIATEDGHPVLKATGDTTAIVNHYLLKK